jgi:hypothetical protein
MAATTLTGSHCPFLSWAREGKTIVTDGIGLSTVVNSALPATFTFLYERLEDLLSRRRVAPGNAQQEAVLETPEIPAVLVGGAELPLRADQDRVQARLEELRAYALGLAHYRRDPALITLEDQLLLQTLDSLRDALEDIYGQRFTFEGELREHSGPISEQSHEKVAGEVIGMEATNTIRGPVTSKITTKSVEPGGRVVGMRGHDIGQSH